MGLFKKKRSLKTKLKRKISKKTGIPLTKAGRQRKIGKMITGGGCLVPFLIMILVPIILLVIILT